MPKLPWREAGEGSRLSDIIEELQSRTDIRQNKEGLLSISVEDQDPKRAAAMVQCYLDELSRVNMELQTTYNLYLTRVLDAPIVPDRKHKPRTTLNTLIGGFATVFLWMAAVFCRLNLAGQAAPVKSQTQEPALT
jgi:capsular polysaccharide biosynthesis protein